MQVFFFKAQWRGGEININHDELEDYAWVTKEEMREFVSKDFYKAIEPVLLDQLQYSCIPYSSFTCNKASSHDLATLS